MIRPLAALSFGSSVAALAFACGGSKPASTSTPTPEPTTTAESVATGAPTAAPSASVAAAPTATASAAGPAGPVAGPTTLKGKLAGKDFEVQAAYAMMGAKPDHVLLELSNQAKSCGALPQTAGATKLGLVVTWKEGTTVDPKSLKGGKEPEAFTMVFTKKFDRKDWKATGKIEVLRAPKKSGELGRVRFETKAGADTLSGEIDVKICGDLP